MGVPWKAQVRFRHLGMLGLIAVPLLLYLAYMSTPQVQQPTNVPVVQPSSMSLHLPAPQQQQQNSNNTSTSTNETLTSKNQSSETPPLLLLQQEKQQQQQQQQSNNNINNDSNASKVVAAESIYESGHMNVSSKCPDLGRDLQVVIVITSAPGHDAARMAIRQTWGHYGFRRDVAIAFMLGSTSNQTINEQINQEEYLYQDIIRGKFVDTYDNLTLKTISMLEWVDNYCSKAAFVLKTDDDMFINVSRLLAFIAKHNPSSRAIYGRLAKKWKPIRNKKSKYYISSQQYKPALFPDFTTGPAYLFPARLSKDLYSAALNHTYFKLEDVFVTGIVANSLKIKRIHVPEFLNKRVSLTPCSVQRSISIHMIKGAEQYDLWKKQLDGITKCK